MLSSLVEGTQQEMLAGDMAAAWTDAFLFGWLSTCQKDKTVHLLYQSVPVCGS